MSYSFNFRAADKAAAKARVKAEFDRIVADEVTHTGDRAAAEAAIGAYIDMLKPEPSKEIAVAVHGSVSWDWPGDAPVKVVPNAPVSRCNVSIEVSLV